MEVDLVHTNVVLNFHYANTLFNNTPSSGHSPFSQSGSFFVPLVSQSSSTHCHRPVLLSQSHTGIFTRLHSPFIITIPSIRRQHPSQNSFHSSSLWRCRNQSRSTFPRPFSRRPPRFSNETFTLYSLSIRSLLIAKISTALTDLASSSRPPDLITYKKPRYLPLPLTPIFLIPNHPATPCFPRITPSSKSAEISGGGSAFLVRELAIVLYSSRHTFKSFECSSITLQLASDILTVFDIYRPPTSSDYSQKPSVFLDEFGSLLSLAATTPNEFVNVHV